MAKEINKLQVWDGTGLRDIIGYVKTEEGLKRFYRSETFRENFINQKGLNRLSMTGLIENNKLIFDSLIRYSIR